MATIAEALAAALRHQQAGQPQQAEQLYRQVLQADPHHAEALHLLGMLAHQAGKHDVALEHLRRALTWDPLNPVYHNNLGLIQLALGRRDEAEACYRRALRLMPDSAEVYHNLGNVLKDRGELDEAVACYRHAVRLKPDHPGMRSSLGNALRERGAADEAVPHYREALRLRPDWADAHNNLGNALQDRGELDEAVAHYREALRLHPGHAEAHSNLGAALRARGELEEALAHYREALRLRPDYFEAHYNLANILNDQEQLDEAVAHYREALRLRPGYAEAHNSLGNALRKQGKADEAVACYRQALHLNPRFTDAHANLGSALAEQGRLEDAAACFRQALRIRPDAADVHAGLGHVAAEQGRLDEALACYRQAVELRPGHADDHARLGQGLNRQGRPEEAAAHLREALRARPADDRLRVTLATLLPPVYPSLEDLHARRRGLIENLRQLHEDGVRLDLDREAAAPLFYLAYQGQNDRDIQRDLARLCTPPAEPAAPAGSRGPRIRVGFLSRFFKDHTIGHLMRGLIARLSRTDFEVTVLSVGGHRDGVAQFLRQHAEHWVEVPANLPAARRVVAGQGLDVLFYTDIGMEPLSYSLAFSRLAPVQCVTWGHPVTTGVPAVDYFVSSGLLETDQADGHYTEALVRLKDLPIYYYRPEPPAPPKGRAAFGLAADAHVYACPQSLFKLHPEFDPLLAAVLRRDGRGVLVLLQGRHRHWEEVLRRRFAAVMPDVLDRVRFLPPVPRADFLGLNAAADVLLDPLHFGGGNTTYEALALGVPVVTLPSAFLRGRITLALYRKMSVPDCVARGPDDYVELAVRLGTDPDYRRAVRAKILAAAGALYEDDGAVRGVEEFFREAVARARRGG